MAEAYEELTKAGPTPSVTHTHTNFLNISESIDFVNLLGVAIAYTPSRNKRCLCGVASENAFHSGPPPSAPSCL